MHANRMLLWMCGASAGTGQQFQKQREDFYLTTVNIRALVLLMYEPASNKWRIACLSGRGNDEIMINWLSPYTNRLIMVFSVDVSCFPPETLEFRSCSNCKMGNQWDSLVVVLSNQPMVSRISITIQMSLERQKLTFFVLRTLDSRSTHHHESSTGMMTAKLRFLTISAGFLFICSLPSV